MHYAPESLEECIIFANPSELFKSFQLGFWKKILKEGLEYIFRIF